MSETSGSKLDFLRRFIPGYATKQARITEAQRQVERRAANEAEQRARAEEFQRAVSIALQKPAVALNPDFNPDTEVERIAQNIQAIELMGKFYPVVINGRPFTGYTGRAEAGSYGDTQEMSQKRYFYLRILSELVVGITRATEHRSVFPIGTNIVTALNLPDEHGVFSYTFANDFLDTDNRPMPFCQINFLLPKADAFELVDVIRVKPDNLERFLELGAKGFSDNSREQGRPRRGISRPPLTDVTVLNLDKFDPSYFAHMGGGSSIDIANLLANNPDGQVERYKY